MSCVEVGGADWMWFAVQACVSGFIGYGVLSALFAMYMPAPDTAIGARTLANQSHAYAIAPDCSGLTWRTTIMVLLSQAEEYSLLHRMSPNPRTAAGLPPCLPTCLHACILFLIATRLACRAAVYACSASIYGCGTDVSGAAAAPFGRRLDRLHIGSVAPRGPAARFLLVPPDTST